MSCGDEVSYLAHIFSGKGMAPDSKEIYDVQEWPNQLILLSYVIPWPGFILYQIFNFTNLLTA